MCSDCCDSCSCPTLSPELRVAGPLFEGLDLANLTPVMVKLFRAGTWVSHPRAPSEVSAWSCRLNSLNNGVIPYHIWLRNVFLNIFHSKLQNKKCKSTFKLFVCVCMQNTLLAPMKVKHYYHLHTTFRKFDKWNNLWQIDCHWIFPFILYIRIFKYSLLIPANECTWYMTLTRFKHQAQMGKYPFAEQSADNTLCAVAIH